jgi:hypothetical protein
MGSSKPSDASLPPVDDAAERTARVRAMLARWAMERVTDEPDWNTEDVEPMRLDSDAGGTGIPAK